jgi:hypothetical protein
VQGLAQAFTTSFKLTIFSLFKVVSLLTRAALATDLAMDHLKILKPTPVSSCCMTA